MQQESGVLDTGDDKKLRNLLEIETERGAKLLDYLC